MIGRIPENILEDILSRVNIVEVISGYIPLKRAGRNFKANCPFHHEKTASFMVSPDKQIYHCFGCGESGNAFKFLMRYERLEFPEAVEVLAKKSGVILPEREKNDPKTTGLFTQLYKINELAAQFYMNVLDSQAGESAKNYLATRGINQDVIQEFKLGFAPDKWDSLINHLRPKGISISLLEKSGLILSKDNGGFYDRFRNRIIFPIFDIKSRILGFGGRVFNETDKLGAKYVNSPETPIYIKGKNLYGLNLAKEAIRDTDSVIIVEGYLDFIMPFQSGIKNIVASLGTALTVEQIALLKRYTHNVVMVYDSDNAGQMATLRTLDLFVEEGMDVRVAILSDGADPDSFVRKFGADEFRKRIENSLSLFEYKLQSCKSRFNAKTVDGKAKISLEILSTVSKFKNAVVKSEYIKRLSEELKINEDALLEELGKIKAEKNPQVETTQNRKKYLDSNATEKLLVKLMLLETELISGVRERIEPQDFHDEKISKIVTILFNLSNEGKTIEANKLVNYFEDAGSLEFICESSLDMESFSDNKEKIVDDCIKVIKNKKQISLQQHLQEEIRKAELLKDEEKLSELRVEFCNLIKKGR